MRTQNLAKVRSLLEASASHINLALKAAENSEILLQLQESFADEVQFVKPSRVFVLRVSRAHPLAVTRSHELFPLRVC